MKTSSKLALIGSVISAIGAVVAAFIGSETTTVSTSSAAPNGSLVVHGNGNPVSRNAVINGSHNTVVYGNEEESQSRRAVSPLIGKWKGTSQYAVPAGELSSSGYSQFLQSGEYNFSGEFRLRNAERLGAEVVIVSKVFAAGTWRTTGDKYSITLADVKTTETVMRRPGKADIDLDKAAASVPGTSRFFRLEDATPRGTSQEYLVLELTATSLRATGQDLPGNGVDYVATRME